jgi:hypothetical protein
LHLTGSVRESQSEPPDDGWRPALVGDPLDGPLDGPLSGPSLDAPRQCGASIGMGIRQPSATWLGLISSAPSAAAASSPAWASASAANAQARARSAISGSGAAPTWTRMPGAASFHFVGT